MRFFSVDIDSAITRHSSAAEAAKAAQEAMEAARRLACSTGEWDDDVDAICWGEIKEQVTSVEICERWEDFGLVALRGHEDPYVGQSNELARLKRENVKLFGLAQRMLAAYREAQSHYEAEHIVVEDLECRLASEAK